MCARRVKLYGKNHGSQEAHVADVSSLCTKKENMDEGNREESVQKRNVESNTPTKTSHFMAGVHKCTKFIFGIPGDQQVEVSLQWKTSVVCPAPLWPTSIQKGNL